jgi:hypothetical protein
MTVVSPNASYISLKSDAGAGQLNGLVSAGDSTMIFSDGAIDTGGLVIGPWGTGPKGLKMDSSGNVGIGTVTPGYKLDVSGGIRSTGETISTSANSFRAVQGNYGTFLRNDGANVYFMITNSADQYGNWNGLRPLTYSLSTGNVTMGHNLTVTGNVTATAFVSTSDRRLKDNIQTSEGLAKLSKLRGVHWNWKSDGTPEYGVIAQEVEAQFPDLVVTNEKGMKSVKYSGLIAPLIEATKEINNKCEMSAEQIQALQASVQKVQQDVQTLRRRLASVEEENASMKEMLKMMNSRLNALEGKETNKGQK